MATRYSRPGNVSHGLLTPLGVYFEDAFKAFRAFFELKTGLPWEERLSKSKNAESDVSGQGRFRYEPPILGRPRGALFTEDSILRSSFDLVDSNSEH